MRVHRKLRQAGVESGLEVFEGQPHGAWCRDANVPESKDAFEEIARFFDKHLGKQRGARCGIAPDVMPTRSR